MKLRSQIPNPGRAGWDPTHAEYYKHYTALISDPQLRARTVEKRQQVARETEVKGKAQEVERRQEIVNAQEASRQKLRIAAQAKELTELLNYRDNVERVEQEVTWQEHLQVLELQKQESERKKRTKLDREAQERGIHVKAVQVEDARNQKVRVERERATKVQTEQDRRYQEIIARQRQEEAQESVQRYKSSLERERVAMEQAERSCSNQAELARAKRAKEEQEKERLRRIRQEQSRRPPIPRVRRAVSPVPASSYAKTMKSLQNERVNEAQAAQDQQKLFERHQDIVSAAIEAARFQADSSSKKRPHSELTDSSEVSHSTLKPTQKPMNAFARMMAAPQKITDPPSGFSQWNSHLQRTFDEQVKSGRVGSEADWAIVFRETVESSIETILSPYLRKRAHPQTKINALHVLIEVATAIAYAPRSVASDLIRNGSLPRTLTNSMLEIAEKMSGSERQTVLKEESFLCKVRTLRYQPLVDCRGKTWKSLDEILRLMKDPGPVDFRLIHDQLCSQLGSCQDVKATATTIRRTIENDITSYVTLSTCFETKYNAINALVDAAAVAMEDEWPYLKAWEPSEEIATAFSDLGKLLDGEEVHKIHSEMTQEADFASKNFLDDFLECMDHDIASFRTKSGLKATRDQQFKSTSCAKFQQFVDKRKSGKTRGHGKDGLLAKILLLRWDNTFTDPSWYKCRDALDDVLEMLVDSSVPLTCERFLWKSEFSLQKAEMDGMHGYDHEKAAKEARAAVDYNISRVLALGRKGCMETKLNAFQILVKIGMKMLDWVSSGSPTSKSEAFQDHLSEDSLTDALMAICDSIVKMGGIDALSAQTLDIVNKLDTLRSPETFDGLDSVLAVICDPSRMGTRAEKRVKSLAVVKTKTVIDLTDD